MAVGNIVPTLRVCMNKACRKAGAHDTVAMLLALASTAKLEPAGLGLTAASELTAASVQLAFASSRVLSCGCLGRCGMGPNVASVETGTIFSDVYKPRSGVSLLQEELQLQIPEEAVEAYLKRAYADRAIRAGKLDDALELLTAALNQAGILRVRAAFLLASLLERRADVHDLRGHEEAARTDRQAAQRMLEHRFESIPA
eukprot:CAMPEP_0119311060 /NCGR_PEP_ID=MMETSP1333-20130426/21461_1 /TAXON_ID=418940 /ORGANISM="Scyphosphaera apsteinii, Strain RCC1455" /LENGTH=199 /DNA_ID=CAMNT_0007315355 /DNA_START=23 /DNA_END=622 /DNA_ORIENTATION=-